MPGLVDDPNQLDVSLASLAREEAVLRLHMGQALEVIGRGAVFDLGFSSLGAYAVERCERSVRWAEGARCLARRVEGLPELRAALVSGRVSWSMSELLARVARPKDEARWLEAAAGRTVRQMRVLVAAAPSDDAQRASVPGSAAMAAGSEERASATGTNRVAASEDETQWADGCAENDDLCTLVCTVNCEDAWLFEATRSLLEQMGVRDADAQSDALLAEAQETLLEALPAEALELGRWQSAHAAQLRWSAELERWRADAEQRCEGNIPSSPLAERAQNENGRTPGAFFSAAARGISSLEDATSHQLDQLVRALHTALARHELELSLHVLHFHRADGWRRLGYATETQYARERLGMSRSSFLARRALALRLEKLPAIGDALGASQIGVEAAVQLVRVATPNTQAAWVERARTRTMKHLREEVAAARVAVRWSGDAECPPPEQRELDAFHALERAVVSGGCHRPRHRGEEASQDVRESATNESQRTDPAWAHRRPWRVMLSSLASWLAAGGVRTSAAPANTPGSRYGASSGRVTLHLKMFRGTRAWWRELEALSRRCLPRTVSWLRFLCLSVWRAWRHLLDSQVAYAHIYARDRHRCMSPVCNRQDVTPHHLTFRSAGGGDEDENVASVCTWCHLHGIHGGRIRATGTADLIHWELGAPTSPCLVVHGRERLAA